MDKGNKDATNYIIKYLKVNKFLHVKFINDQLLLQSDEHPMNEIKKVGIFSPYILFVGDDELHPMQYFVVSETKVTSETTSFTKAVVNLMSWYYIMDIQYPQKCRNTYGFIEAMLLKLPSTSTTLTASAIQAISSMEHL